MNERIVLDGFHYELQRVEVRTIGKLESQQAVVVTFHDDARGIDVEAWFPAERWGDFKATIAKLDKEIQIAGAGELRRVGA